MVKDLVEIHNEQLVYSEIIPKMESASDFYEISENTFEYKRRGQEKMDELEIQLANGAKVTYILDSRSSLTYKTLSGPSVRLKGYVYDRQPQIRNNS
ncbi:hypothetical protein [Nitrosopumilus piranensis]|uniref:Uncharacterized protein n=1 Tax=Nitrosopumilus piranensis TaxID=1582439 RepID=A0A0C5BR13_9ARCH|nr:hypothetical protein [Nitrosopumilus piranensis]AJM92198.1 hypothetical protein NPIRD3C_0986 [Nitrosopumilus piranensis]